MHPVAIHAYTSPCSTSNVSRHMTVTPMHRPRHLWPLNPRDTHLAPCRQRPQTAAHARASTHHTSPSGYISSAAAAGLEAEPLVGSDLTAAIDGLLAPLASRAWALLGATDKWQLYLLNRFLLEVVLPVAAVYAMLALVSRGVQMLDDPGTSARSSTTPKPAGAPSATATAQTTTAQTSAAQTTTAQSTTGQSTAAQSTTAQSSSSSASSNTPRTGLLQLVPLVLSGGPARTFLHLVIAVHVSRVTATILDDFIRRFNPRLPYNWLDDLVHLMGSGLTPLDSFLTNLSLAGTALFACAVALRWKDMTVAWWVKQYVEALDPGHELVNNFIMPASNLANLLIIVGTIAWLAGHLGLNLQPLLAVGGASGIIIGLGTQQVLGNFVSGLNIFLARPFVAGEYISILGPNLSASQVSGKVVRIDPMRTLLATEDFSTIAVPNKLMSECVVINRSRTPHWSVGSPSPLLANVRELRFRMQLPHSTLPMLKELQQKLEDTINVCLPSKNVRHSDLLMEVVKFTESGAEMMVKCNLVWRVARAGGEPLLSRELHARQEAREALLQKTLLELQAVVRGLGGTFIAGTGWT